ncbi:MAG: hypothetical protein BJ554DRAFT_666 [Olpidium bornovanus]|uniref:Kinesin motor domain-containing protein n=1 Tax=Olpidium bornovanus TaxID=278681 RepID=A0A8H7ZTG5_9FUNG|nr:MAG: hypothetical protein BJ554DRAFT_666 [Olpidium bornovanus]
MRHHSAPLANEQGAPPWYRPHQFEAGHPPLHLLQRQHGPLAPGAISEAMHDSFVLSQPLATPSSVDSSWSSVSEAAARAHASDGGNAGIDSEKDQCIRVAVRVRPLSDLEQSRSDPSAVTVFNDRRTLQVCGPSDERRVFRGLRKALTWFTFVGLHKLPCADGKVISPMTFDVVEDETVSQEQVFHECGVIELMHQALNGYE